MKASQEKNEIKTEDTTSTSTTAPGTTAVQRPEEDPVATENAKYMLTKEMAINAAIDNMGTRGAVVVTWANYHYKSFVMNWVEHLKATGCVTYLVGKYLIQ